MSLRAIRWCLEQLPPEWAKENVEGLSPAERLVLVSLSHHHNEHTHRCDPGAGRIARQTGLNLRTVRGALETLEQKELITWRRRWWDSVKKRPRSNFYELALDRGDPLPEDDETRWRETTTPVATDHLPSGERPPERKKNVHKNAAAANKEKGAISEEVRTVFDSWSRSLQDGTTPTLTARRADLIARSLEHSTLEELVRAVKSWPHNEYFSGRKYDKGPQNRLDQLLKDRESIEELNKDGLIREKQELVVLDSLALDLHGKPYSQLTEAEQAAVKKSRQEDSW
jgi:DNA-binding transcriptional ArsR family regulator